MLIFWTIVLSLLIGGCFAYGWYLLARKKGKTKGQSYDALYGMSADPTYDYDADVRITLLEEFETEPSDVLEAEQGQAPLSGA